MSLIDFILNVAGILLCLNWRSVSTDPFTSGTPATLLSTVKRAQPMRVKRWHYLAALAGLLVVRAVFYWQVGPAVNWTPKLGLFFVVLTFRGAFFLPSLFFSMLSFLQAFVVFYFWLLVLAALNRNASGSDPIQKMISLQLGSLSRWRWFAQTFTPFFAVAALWIILHPAMVYTGVTNRIPSSLHLVEQSLLAGAAIFLSLKYFLPAFLAVHLVTSYIYLGKSPLLDFSSLTARNILGPLDRLSLRAGKIDLAPIFGIVLILLLLHALPNFALAYLGRCNLTVWPQ
jgi:uncharacterized protein YggT (Ycf19 family)